MCIMNNIQIWDQHHVNLRDADGRMVSQYFDSLFNRRVRRGIQKKYLSGTDAQGCFAQEIGSFLPKARKIFEPIISKPLTNGTRKI